MPSATQHSYQNAQTIQLLRKSNGEVVLPRLRWCSSFLCRLRGLTLRRRLAPGEGLVLVEAGDSRMATAIHMLFVFFPIAVVWLDSRMRVVDTRLAMPWRPIYVPRAPAQYAVEAAPDMMGRVEIGEELEFAE